MEGGSVKTDLKPWTMQYRFRKEGSKTKRWSRWRDALILNPGWGRVAIPSAKPGVEFEWRYREAP